mgnify:CR=1 FL=1
MNARASKAAFVILLCISVVSCGQSAPPMSRETFETAARHCGLNATTYTYRDGWLLDEPLIDFSGEPKPDEAHQCFNRGLETADREMTERGVTSISYIWEWKT